MVLPAYGGEPAPDLPAADTVVVRRLFWTGDRSLTRTFNALKTHVPAGLHVAGEGSSTDHGHVIERDLGFLLAHPPGTLASVQLEIEVVRDGHGHSAVGAYAEVVPQPRRQAREHVPLSVRTAGVAKINESDNTVVARKTVTGSNARRLVHDFDALRVQPPQGVHPCPLQLTAVRATFRADGHVWRAVDSICGSVMVARDGRRLPDLVPDRAFSHALRADLR
jgi:hypothetical protein